MTTREQVPPLEGVHHLKVPVTDLERSRAFYETAYGAQRIPDADHHREDDGTLYAYILRVPGLGAMIEMRLDPDQARAQMGFDPFTIAVKDRAALDAWVAHLDAHGLRHSPVIAAIQAWLVVVPDPDDHRLRLYTLETHGPEIPPDEDNPWLHRPRHVVQNERKDAMTQMHPVLIVGAGPTGMMAALELTRFRIPVRLIEKTLEPATTSRAVGVQARTLELFEQRGLAAALLEKGNPAHAASGWGGGKRVFQLKFDSIDSKYPFLLFVSQAITEGVLRDALKKAGVEVEWGVTMTSLGEVEHSQVVHATIEKRDGSGEQVTCAYLISAEGAHSTARQTLGLKYEGKSLEEQYALGDLHLDSELPENEMHVFSSEYGFMGMFPMGGGRWRLIASNPLSKPSKDTEPGIDELQKLYDQRSPVPGRFRDMSWSSWFHINSRMIKTMRVRRILFGGDSAHIHSPAGAQGMNTGMQDMINLAWKMAMVMKGEARPELLDTYGVERVPIIENVLTKTEGLTAAIGNENRVFRSIFNHVMPWVASLDAVQHNSAERMSQLGLNYEGGPLAVSDGRPGNLKPGDRMPDLSVTVLNRQGSPDREPEPATAFGLMDPSRFTIFYTNIADPAKTHAEINERIGAWHDRIGGRQVAAGDDAKAFGHLFGKTPGITLVRPDGYVAFVGTDKSVKALAEYCDKWLVRSDHIAAARDDAKETHHA